MDHGIRYAQRSEGSRPEGRGDAAFSLNQIIVRDLLGSFIPEDVFTPEEMKKLDIREATQGLWQVAGDDTLVQRLADKASLKVLVSY